MPSLDKMQDYLQEVCGQIRWKKARKPIAQELECHILDQRDTLVKQGLDEQTALTKAVEEMGDPVAVGVAFDRTYRPKMQWGLMGFVLLLCLLGVILQGIAQGNMAHLSRSLLTLAVGVGAMLLGNWMDFTLFSKRPFAIYAAFALVTLGGALLSSGTNTWMLWSDMAFSPRNLLLFAPLAFAGVIYSMRGRGLWGVLLCGVAFVPLLWLGLYSSVSITFIITFAGLALLTIAVMQGLFGCKKWNALLLIYLPVCAVVAAIVQLGGMRWMHILWNPYLAPEGEGFLGVILREMLQGAHWTGPGTFPATEMLPVIKKGFFLTYLIHAKGWLLGVVLLGLLVAFVLWSTFLCLRQKSNLGKLVAASIVLTIGIQALLSTVQNLGLLIFSGVALPFVDNNSGTLILNLFLVGILLSVFKCGDLVRDTGCHRRAMPHPQSLADDSVRLGADLYVAKRKKTAKKQTQQP